MGIAKSRCRETKEAATTSAGAETITGGQSNQWVFSCKIRLVAVCPRSIREMEKFAKKSEPYARFFPRRRRRRIEPFRLPSPPRDPLHRCQPFKLRLVDYNGISLKNGKSKIPRKPRPRLDVVTHDDAPSFLNKAMKLVLHVVEWLYV